MALSHRHSRWAAPTARARYRIRFDRQATRANACRNSSSDFAPTVAIEVLSPGDDERDTADKTAVYLAGGTKLVIVVDPASRSVMLDDGRARIVLDSDATLRHPALPEFELGLADFFRRALDLSI